MKRILIMLVSLGLLVVSLGTAEAAKSKRVERTVQGSYGAYPAPVTGCNEVVGQYACLTVPTHSTERFFTAKATDTHGQPVYVEARWDGGGSAVFCGETMEPIAIMPGVQLNFDVGLPSWPRAEHLPHCPANRVKTTGTITVTLSNQR